MFQKDAVCYLLTCCWKFLSTKLKEAIKVHCWPKWPEWPPWWPNEMASVSMGKWWRDICNEIHSHKTWEISVSSCHIWKLSFVKLERNVCRLMVVEVVKFSKLERFWPKNQHTQRKFMNFQNWWNGEVLKIGHHFSNNVI